MAIKNGRYINGKIFKKGEKLDEFNCQSKLNAFRYALHLEADMAAIYDGTTKKTSFHVCGDEYDGGVEEIRQRDFEEIMKAHQEALIPA